MADAEDIIAMTRRPLSSILASVPTGTGTPVTGLASLLPFVMQLQEQDLWCWAAVAVSVCDHYGTSSGWTQCELADAELGQLTCCNDGASGRCNRGWYLNRALSRTNNLVRWEPGTSELSTVANEIASGHPVGVRIQWAGGGGHFVVVAGYQQDPEGDTIAVYDPWPGFGDTLAQDWEAFHIQYQGSGQWTHTYYTSS